jgi:ferric-dicitrate binding protein FerR (iron transport regulator)
MRLMSDESDLSLDPRLRDVLRSLDTACSPGRVPADTDLAWSRLATRTVDARRTGRLVLRGKNSSSSMHWRVLAGVGVATLALIVTSQQFTAPSQSASFTRTYATTRGQRASLTLGDGSRVQLGPDSRLTVVTNPRNTTVDVQITGQAMFSVIANTRRTFSVHTGIAVARVLGTTFMVRRYDTDRVARVIVTEGRVALDVARSQHAHSAGIVLTASTAGTVDDSGRVRRSSPGVVEEYTAWTTGQLVFRNTPARDAVIELSRAYDVDIRIADSVIAAHPIDWTVPVARRSLADVLEFLTIVLDAHSVRRGRTITLVAGRLPRSESGGVRPSYSTFLPERQRGR